MQTLKSFLQVIRWPNLVFIIITQLSFYFLVMVTLYNKVPLLLTPSLLVLLIIASVCIAAAGNIINDYFDVNIDLINKPNKQIVGKHITPRTAIRLHLMLSIFGVVISFVISNIMHQHWLWLGWCNLLAVLVLILYSASLKKKLIIGNIVVAVLVAWVIVILVCSQLQVNYLALDNTVISASKITYSKLFAIGMLYAVFAFTITLIREVAKDMEDYIGDMQYNCRTIPIAWGFQASKVFVAVCTMVIIIAILLLQFFLLQYFYYYVILYCLVAIVAPLVFSLKVLIAAQATIHYSLLSNIYKAIMLTGILSMIFFKIYA